MSTPSKHRAQLALLIKTPNIAQLRLQFFAKDLTSLCPHIQVAGCKYDLVGGEFGAVGEAYALREDFGDLAALLDADGAGGDEGGGADVDIVAAAALEVLYEEAGVGWP